MTDDGSPAPFEAPLPDSTYSVPEKAVIWTAIGLGLAVLAGLMLAFDTVWTDTCLLYTSPSPRD